MNNIFYFGRRASKTAIEVHNRNITEYSETFKVVWLLVKLETKTRKKNNNIKYFNNLILKQLISNRFKYL